jgi:membrane protease YdiL (CAAX protease family)
MSTNLINPEPLPGTQRAVPTILITLGIIAFCAVFVVLDNAYNAFANAHFPAVGESAELATLWGVVSRAHLFIFIIPLVIWRRKLFGFQIGESLRHWRMILIMLLANCGVIAVYLALTAGSTPYSGNQWLVTEVVTVPVVEELFWRGLVFAVLLKVLGRYYPENKSMLLTVWLTGIVFGLMHGNNIFAGVPVQFVAVQVLNATIWGVMYSFARARTGSVFPPMLLHAAMNLVVILF